MGVALVLGSQGAGLLIGLGGDGGRQREPWGAKPLAIALGPTPGVHFWGAGDSVPWFTVSVHRENRWVALVREAWNQKLSDASGFWGTPAAKTISARDTGPLSFPGVLQGRSSELCPYAWRIWRVLIGGESARGVTSYGLHFDIYEITSSRSKYAVAQSHALCGGLLISFCVLSRCVWEPIDEGGPASVDDMTEEIKRAPQTSARVRKQRSARQCLFFAGCSLEVPAGITFSFWAHKGGRGSQRCLNCPLPGIWYVLTAGRKFPVGSGGKFAV